MIKFEDNVCKYLQIPSIPLKEWDGKSFKHGVAVIKLTSDMFAYAVCTYDDEYDESPRVTKVFSAEPFFGIEKIYVVPSYMDVDMENADLDDESKKAAQSITDEVDALIVNNDAEPIHQTSEYFFDNITNDEEAIAFIKAYNRKNNIRGSIPKKHETLVLRLGVIYSETNK